MGYSGGTMGDNLLGVRPCLQTPYPAVTLRGKKIDVALRWTSMVTRTVFLNANNPRPLVARFSSEVCHVRDTDLFS
mgnify:CR=1 FL=1